MTKEEAIEILSKLRSYTASIAGIPDVGMCGYSWSQIANACLHGYQALEQEPKTGTWEWLPLEGNSELGNWFCSECDFSPASYDLEKKHFNYCPNCGADMRGDEND